MVNIAEAPQIHHNLDAGDLFNPGFPRAPSAAELTHQRVTNIIKRINIEKTRARLTAKGYTPEKLREWKIAHGLLPNEAAAHEPDDKGERFLQGEAVVIHNGT
jgi:hypothetical protein